MPTQKPSQSHETADSAPTGPTVVDEMVAFVDASNRELEPQPRSRVRLQGLRHRASYIFVFHSDGRVLLQRRALSKDLFPGWYDACAGGVLRPGERYCDNAMREIAEELGLHDCVLKACDEFYFEHEQLRVFGATFCVQHDGPFAFTDAEVQWADFVPAADIVAGCYGPLTPDSLFALQRLRGVSDEGSARRR